MTLPLHTHHDNIIIILCTHLYRRWFDLYNDPDTGTLYHVFNGKYWDCKLRGDWHRCPDIYWHAHIYQRPHLLYFCESNSFNIISNTQGGVVSRKWTHLNCCCCCCMFYSFCFEVRSFHNIHAHTLFVHIASIHLCPSVCLSAVIHLFITKFNVVCFDQCWITI